MDRARVLSPSISFAAHFTGAALLAVVPLFLPDRLPPMASPLPDPPSLAGVLAVSLGSRPLGGGQVRPVRVTPPARPVDPRLVLSVPLPTPEDMSLGNGAGVVGLDEFGDGTGDGIGVCLVNCGSGGGPSDGVGSYAPPPAQAAGPVRVRPGGVIREPVKVRHVTPVYPQLAIATRVQGKVVIDCVIDENGNVTSLAVLQSSPLFDQAAVEAVRQWRYRPTLLNGSPISVILAVTVEFRLR